MKERPWVDLAIKKGVDPITFGELADHLTNDTLPKGWEVSEVQEAGIEHGGHRYQFILPWIAWACACGRKVYIEKTKGGV